MSFRFRIMCSGVLMGSSRLLLVALVLLLGIAALAQTSAVDCSPAGHRSCATPQTKSEVQLSEPGQSSLSAPKVVYTQGQLAITAMNSTLGDVLRAVSAQTGAVVEFPPGSVEERVVLNLGPGPVRDVLAALLNGTRFNYVILVSPSDPTILQRMTLTDAEDTGSVSTQWFSAQPGGPALHDHTSNLAVPSDALQSAALSPPTMTEMKADADHQAVPASAPRRQPNTCPSRSGLPTPQAVP